MYITTSVWLYYACGTYSQPPQARLSWTTLQIQYNPTMKYFLHADQTKLFCVQSVFKAFSRFLPWSESSLCAVKAHAAVELSQKVEQVTADQEAAD